VYSHVARDENKQLKDLSPPSPTCSQGPSLSAAAAAPDAPALGGRGVFPPVRPQHGRRCLSLLQCPRRRAPLHKRRCYRYRCSHACSTAASLPSCGRRRCGCGCRCTVRYDRIAREEKRMRPRRRCRRGQPRRHTDGGTGAAHGRGSGSGGIWRLRTRWRGLRAGHARSVASTAKS